MKHMKPTKKLITLLFIFGIIITGGILFSTAGSFKYWNAWVFIGVLFIPFLFSALYFSRKKPKLLERRMKFEEKESQQKLIIKLANLIFFLGLLVPGLDYRFGWSNISNFFVIFSNVMIFIGYLIVFFAFRENSYASRIIEVEKKQKVIATGPYSVIRHPMYFGVALMFLFMPLALGSYPALVFFIPVIILLIFRILNEEDVLLRDLKGYKKYTKKVKYRIIPYVW
ncbi:MAG: isoprenylcysteine carboxylmethyltransferase family protein [archaeon]|nr:isoprenylcysteine carboxylmethyltransferase family protein [archaeon]